MIFTSASTNFKQFFCKGEPEVCMVFVLHKTQAASDKVHIPSGVNLPCGFYQGIWKTTEYIFKIWHLKRKRKVWLQLRKAVSSVDVTSLLFKALRYPGRPLLKSLSDQQGCGTALPHIHKSLISYTTWNLNQSQGCYCLLRALLWVSAEERMNLAKQSHIYTTANASLFPSTFGERAGKCKHHFKKSKRVVLHSTLLKYSWWKV